jgi:hypothetical protein
MVRCRLLGHRYAFSSQGPVMHWSCERGCGAGGSKRYGSADDAALFASAFDRRDADDLGKRAPYFGLLPLRLVRALRGRARRA